MRDFRRQIEKIEKRLNVGKEPIIVEIVCFGDGDTPPEHAAGGITVRCVHYENIRKGTRAGKG